MRKLQVCWQWEAITTLLIYSISVFLLILTSRTYTSSDYSILMGKIMPKSGSTHNTSTGEKVHTTAIKLFVRPVSFPATKADHSSQRTPPGRKEHLPHGRFVTIVRTYPNSNTKSRPSFAQNSCTVLYVDGTGMLCQGSETHLGNGFTGKVNFILLTN